MFIRIYRSSGSTMDRRITSHYDYDITLHCIYYLFQWSSDVVFVVGILMEHLRLIGWWCCVSLFDQGSHCFRAFGEVWQWMEPHTSSKGARFTLSPSVGVLCLRLESFEFEFESFVICRPRWQLSCAVCFLHQCCATCSGIIDKFALFGQQAAVQVSHKSQVFEAGAASGTHWSSLDLGSNPQCPVLSMEGTNPRKLLALLIAGPSVLACWSKAFLDCFRDQTGM